VANGFAGGVSAYQGAFVFFQLPHGLVAVSLMTTIAPDLAGAAGRGDLAAFRDRFDLGVRLMVLAILPAAAGYLVLSRPVVGFLLERGALSGASADLTADCLALFALGLVPFSVYLYALRGFYALHDTRTPFLLNAMENGINIALALVLSRWLDVPGLALGYAGAYAVAAVAAVAVLGRRTGERLGGTVRALARPLTAAALMAAVVAAVVAVLPDRTPDAVVVAVGVPLGAATYFGALAALGVSEAGELLARLRRRGR
jgi:putative peptidoglycan lipid II flippase